MCVRAVAACVTDVHCTLIDVIVTDVSLVTSRALARKAGISVYARCVVVAGIIQTIVDVVAIMSRETLKTITAKAAIKVNAGSAIETDTGRH